MNENEELPDERESEEEEDEEFFFVESGEPIPEELHSEYEERPFKTCTRCGETLVDFDEGYQVAKVFRAGEAVFEYALCLPCHSSMQDEFSTETKQKMEAFFSENAKTHLGIRTCAICEIEREALPQEEYALTGFCGGELMMQGVMFCAPCIERTNDLVSKKTRDVWRDFIGENFPGVPADALPDPSRVPVF
ncbi:MAG: hypothetical protein ACI8XO_004885 [Verrucomicrobiales bacterium]|jgi:hypothetical protein